MMAPLDEATLRELRERLDRIERPQSAEAFAARLAQIGEVNAMARPDRALFLAAAAVALWGAFECERRDRRRADATA